MIRGESNIIMIFNQIYFITFELEELILVISLKKKRITLAGEKGEDLLSGVLDVEKELYSIDYKSDNFTTDLRASAEHYGCTAVFWAAGSAVSVPLGMVNPLLGLTVGFGYALFSDWACGHIE